MDYINGSSAPPPGEQNRHKRAPWVGACKCDGTRNRKNENCQSASYPLCFGQQNSDSGDIWTFIQSLTAPSSALQSFREIAFRFRRDFVCLHSRNAFNALKLKRSLFELTDQSILRLLWGNLEGIRCLLANGKLLFSLLTKLASSGISKTPSLDSLPITRRKLVVVASA